MPHYHIDGLYIGDDAVARLRQLYATQHHPDVVEDLRLVYMAAEAGVDNVTLTALHKFADLIRADHRTALFGEPNGSDR